MPRKKTKRPIGVIDFETDPFKYGRVPEPFCCEFYTGETSIEFADFVTEYIAGLSDNIRPFVTAEFTDIGISIKFWGPDCAEWLIDFLRACPVGFLIYAHNGGKFDFHFILKYIENPVLVIKTRITKAKLFQHELRDSFSILPVPLRDYDKLEFDYSKMERPRREKHKGEILEYLHFDCLKLYELVAAFVAKFGAQLTIGGAAMKEISRLHPFNKSGRRHDEQFRKYYHGGAVRVLKSGIMRGPWKLFDVNGSYPASMRNKKHPINGMFEFTDKLPDNFDMPYFVTFEGENYGALPTVAEDNSLTFEQKSGIFRVCSHELEVALKYDLVKINKIHECLISVDAISFAEFVDKWADEKAKAKEIGNLIDYLFAKLISNSGYGRFAINPENFRDWVIHRDFGNDEELKSEGYSIAADYGDIELWSKQADISNDDYCDVATAASITSAIRALLLEGLQNADTPLYCDTDSIICRDFNGDIHKSRLGAWDLEKTADIVAIGGKKMYALYNDAALAEFNGRTRSHASMNCSKCKLPFKDANKHREHQLSCGVKLSSKGGSLNLSEIVKIASGEVIHFENDAPTFSLVKKPVFISRDFRSTVDLGEGVD